MILDEFQRFYPTGSLISELVQIYNGKYIVKVTVQIEGTTRTTGMAGAESIEDAEDKARNRALMILGTQFSVEKPETSSLEVKNEVKVEPKVELKAEPKAEPKVEPKVELKAEPKVEPKVEPKFEPKFEPRVEPKVEPKVSVTNDESNYLHSQGTFTEQEVATNVAAKNDAYIQDFSQRFPVTNSQEQNFPEPQYDAPQEEIDLFSVPPEEGYKTEIPLSNVTSFPQRNYTTEVEEETVKPAATSKRKKKTEPQDLSDLITKSDIEMQRLSWTPQDGREHLKKTYDKRARSLLTPEELQDFVKHLESLPTPIDPLAGF